MEKAENIEKIGNENLKLAEKEKEISLDTKKVAKLELKRSKAREGLVKADYDVSGIKKELAEKMKKLVEKKYDIMNLVNYSEADLKAEMNAANYNDKLANSQIQIADIQKRIAHIEKEISEEKFKHAKENFNLAKERESLGKKQLSYVKSAQSQEPPEKISLSEQTYMRQEKELNKAKKDLMDRETKIKDKETELANLKKELSVKLDEREKIRPMA